MRQGTRVVRATKVRHAATESLVLKMGLVAFSGISASSDSRAKFLWQKKPSDRQCLMLPLKQETLQPEYKCIKKHIKY